MRKALTFALVVFALGGVLAALYKRALPPAGESVTAVAPEQQAPVLHAPGVIVTYFTTDVRCPSCIRIETLTRATMESRFGGELASGQVLFRVINTDREENRHHIGDYQLVSKTVIVSGTDDAGQAGWVNLQDVWMKLGDEGGFGDYVEQAVRAFL